MPVIAVTKERQAGEARVAATPDSVKKLTAAGFSVIVESGAGAASSYPDADYAAAGAEVAADAGGAIGKADILFKVRGPAPEEIAALKAEALVVGMLNPHQDKDTLNALAARACAPSPWRSCRGSPGPR